LDLIVLLGGEVVREAMTRAGAVEAGGALESDGDDA